MLHAELRRGLDAGLFSIVGCFIQAFNVPIIPPEDLCDFFKSSVVSYLSLWLSSNCVIFVMSVAQYGEYNMIDEKENTLDSSEGTDLAGQILDKADDCEHKAMESDAEKIDLNLESEVQDDITVEESEVQDDITVEESEVQHNITVEDCVVERWADVVSDIKSLRPRQIAGVGHATAACTVTGSSQASITMGDLLEKIKDIQSKYDQTKDVIERLEMIFNQAVGRLDDQMSFNVTHQKRHSNAIHELRSVVQALVAEIGEEVVNSRMMSLQLQGPGRQHDSGRDYNFASGDRGAFYKGNGDASQRSGYTQRGYSGGSDYAPNGGGYTDTGDYGRRRMRGGGRRQF